MKFLHACALVNNNLFKQTGWSTELIRYISSRSYRKWQYFHLTHILHKTMNLKSFFVAEKKTTKAHHMHNAYELSEICNIKIDFMRESCSV